MNNFLAFSVLSTATFILSFPFLKAEAVPNNYQSFEQWCIHKSDLSTETRKTVDVLLEKADTKDCKLANFKLNSLDELQLYEKQISDLR